MNVIGVKYDSKNMDFETMMFQEEYKNTLFIFNDNQVEHNSSKKGAGNAVIRPYNKYSGLKFPKSAGIPTGNYRQGYQSLEEGLDDIDKSFDEIETLLKTGYYSNIVYSIDNYNNPLIGRGIFIISNDVKSYITKRIVKLGIGGNYFFNSDTYGFSEPIPITITCDFV